MSDSTKDDTDTNNMATINVNTSSPLEFFDQADFLFEIQENKTIENDQITESQFSIDKIADCSSPKTIDENTENDRIISEIYENTAEEFSGIKTSPESCDNLHTINSPLSNINEESNGKCAPLLQNIMSKEIETEFATLCEEKIDEKNLSHEEIPNKIDLVDSLNIVNTEIDTKNEEIIENSINEPIKTESEDIEMETLDSVDIDLIKTTEIHVEFVNTDSTEIDNSPPSNEEESKNQSNVEIGNSNTLSSSIIKLEIPEEHQSVTESVSPIELKLELETKPEKPKSLKRRKSITPEIDSNTPRKSRKIDNQLDATPIVKRRQSVRIEEKKRVKLEVSVLSTEKNKRVTGRKSSISPNKKPPRKSTTTGGHPNQDPGKWPQSISRRLKTELISKGPIQIENAIFPRDERNRCFSINSYSIKTPNGDKQRRNWIVYSQSCDAVFCFPCRIFAYDSNSSFANVGYNNWKKLADRILTHEESVVHQASLEKWVEHSVEIDGEISGLKISDMEAKNMAKSLRQFASGKNNKLYLLAKQMELELEALCEKDKPKKK